MGTITVYLASVQDVKDFVEAALRVPDAVDVEAKKYRVDGKSIMGMLSLDTTKPLKVVVDEEYIEDFERWAV